MKRIKSTLLSLVAIALFIPVGISSNQAEVNWTPSIFANGQSYITTFQHSEKNLKFYTSEENVEINGAMMMATVIRFAPNIMNASAPTQDAIGLKESRNLFNFSQTIDLSGQINGGAVVVEIYDIDIDVNNPATIGNPKGKGTLVSTIPPSGG